MTKEKQVVLITGSTKGVGFALAQHLVQQGHYRVVLNSRSQGDVEGKVQELQSIGRAEDILGICADLQSEEQISALFDQIIEKVGRIDVVVNNAAQTGSSKQPFHKMPTSEWKSVMNTNVQGTYLCYHYAVNAMIKRQQGGKIINLSSGITKAFSSAPLALQLGTYALSKHAVEAFTSLAAQEVYQEQIAVCCLSIDESYQSDMTQPFFEPKQFSWLKEPKELMPIFDHLLAAEWSSLTGRNFSSERFFEDPELEALVTSPYSYISLATGTLPIPEKKKYLCSGENPNAPATRILELLKNETFMLGRYPRSYGVKGLKSALAQKFNVQESMVFVGNGTVSCVESIMQIFVPAAHHILCHEATWSFIPDLLKARGISSIQIGIDFEGKKCHFHLDKMLKSISASTRLIYLTNPNYPTGHNLKKQEFLDFVKQVPKNIPVVVDECYADYSVKEDKFCVAELLSETDHPIIGLRTLSKLYGLANLRIGYVLAHPLTIKAIERYHLPWTVSDINAVCATKALRDEGYHREMVQKAAVERNYMQTELDALGIGYSESDSMTIMIDCPKAPFYEFRRLLSARGVILVPSIYKKRFTYQVGKRQFNQQVIEVLAELKQKAD